MMGRPKLTGHEWWNRAKKRFWSKVDVRSSNECWNWIGHTINTGYGQFGWRTHRHELAHRAAWILDHVKPIPDGMWILHLCGNKLCCNPLHLHLGTRADNVHDAIVLGEIQCGENHHQSKLTTNDVLRIRKLRSKCGYSQDALATMFDISQTQIWRIIHKVQWHHQ